MFPIPPEERGILATWFSEHHNNIPSKVNQEAGSCVRSRRSTRASVESNGGGKVGGKEKDCKTRSACLGRRRRRLAAPGESGFGESRKDRRRGSRAESRGLALGIEGERWELWPSGGGNSQAGYSIPAAAELSKSAAAGETEQERRGELLCWSGAESTEQRAACGTVGHCLADRWGPQWLRSTDILGPPALRAVG